MPSPLIHTRWRHPAKVAIAGSLLVLAVLSALLCHTSTNRVDTWITDQLAGALSPAWRSALFDLASPAISLWLLGAVVVVGAGAKRWDVAALAIVAPSLSLALTQFVLKPCVDRTHFGGIAFPSGHETLVAATAFVVSIALVQLPLERRPRVGAVVMPACWAVLAASGLVAALAHYASDTVGSLAVATVVVLSAALAIDRWLPRPRRPGPVNRTSRRRPSPAAGAPRAA